MSALKDQKMKHHTWVSDKNGDTKPTTAASGISITIGNSFINL